ncbi:MAG: hypothetical protein K2Y26_10165 [Gemmatimonadaceae bacterium]|jgi:hypothetical protein|nr:hypothetical protein [Gemmatimonadaceae bacterium]
MSKKLVVLALAACILAMPADAQSVGRVPEKMSNSRAIQDHPATVALADLLVRKFESVSVSRFSFKRSDNGKVSDAVRDRLLTVQKRSSRSGDRVLAIEYEMLEPSGDTISLLVQESNLGTKKGDTGYVSKYLYRFVEKAGQYILAGRLMLSSRDLYVES